MGVTIKKKIIPITSGEIILDNKIPNLNQIMFKGFNNFDFNAPSNKKISDMMIAQILILPLSSNGQKPIIKKTIKNTIPKFLVDGSLIFFCI